MKKLVLAVLLIIALVAIAGVVALRSDTVALALIERALNAQGPGPNLPEETLTVVVCGSASPLGAQPDRAQACIAVLTDQHFFVFDLGAGSAARLSQARLPTPRLTGVFLTHLHSDHIADVPAVNLPRWAGGGASEPLTIFGPAGIDSVVAGFNEAYRIDRGFRVAHHGADFMPLAGGMLSSKEIEPGVVWSDESLSITAFTVEHDPISPAYGYRVDYGERSVVISGDTTNTPRLWEAAAGADLVFHDALALPVLKVMSQAALSAGQLRLARIVTDVMGYHAELSGLQASADAAGVGRLILYHLVPSPPNALVKGFFERAVTAPSLVAEDLMRFELPVDSKTVRVQVP
ncbi:MAG: MBL fold metallo-hydrolase [Proteobacteria bacterium]|jgi:ribonuclease Z|nr:MBL fold metallo-hydrolase [Pseudomonadota bacterium]MDA0957807.1 MBL fold metallo-hydrolase [Pseudomonadota bacterium]MDA1207375.1 MBL fold metallo-hydrolase [Pseudomonadota bacterium]